MARRLMKAKEVAETLGVSISTVYSWTEQGKLAVHELGSGSRACLRWREDDLERFIRQGRRTAAS